MELSRILFDARKSRFGEQEMTSNKRCDGKRQINWIAEGRR
jgi:hypothetical protein